MTLERIAELRHGVSGGCVRDGDAPTAAEMAELLDAAAAWELLHENERRPLIYDDDGWRVFGFPTRSPTPQAAVLAALRKQEAPAK